MKIEPYQEISPETAGPWEPREVFCPQRGKSCAPHMGQAGPMAGVIKSLLVDDALAHNLFCFPFPLPGSSEFKSVALLSVQFGQDKKKKQKTPSILNSYHEALKHLFSLQWLHGQ